MLRELPGANRGDSGRPHAPISMELSDDEAAIIADAVNRKLQALADGKTARKRDQVRDAIKQGSASAGSHRKR